MKNRILQVISFGIAGNAEQYQRSGWAAPEHGFNWTLGQESAISIPTICTCDEVYLEFFVLPRTRDIGPLTQRMAVTINGTALGGGPLPLPCLIAFHVPRHVLHGQTLDIVIEHPDGFSDKPGTPDYALALVSLRLIARDVGPFNVREGLISGFLMARITPSATGWLKNASVGTKFPSFRPHPRPQAVFRTHVSRQVRNRSRTRNRFASAQVTNSRCAFWSRPR